MSVEPAEATATYQWQSATEQDGVYTDITNAKNSSYLLTDGENGKYIKVKASGTGEYTGEVVSTATAAVTPAAKSAERSK